MKIRENHSFLVTLNSSVHLNNWNIEKRKKKAPGNDTKISSHSLKLKIIFDFYPIMQFKGKQAKKECFCSIDIPQLSEPHKMELI